MSVVRDTDALVKPEFLQNEELEEVYKSVSAKLFQRVYPARRRVDTISPSTPSLDNEAYLYQQGMNFMKLKLGLTNQYQCTVTVPYVNAGILGTNANVPDVTGDFIIYNPNAGANYSTGPTPLGILNFLNFNVDAFSASKNVKNVKVECGQTTFYSSWAGVAQRNPLLIELKSFFMDQKKLDSMGIEAGLFSGCGFFGNKVSPGLILRETQAKMTEECLLETDLLTWSNEIANFDMSKKMLTDVAERPARNPNQRMEFTQIGQDVKIVAGSITAKNITDNVDLRVVLDQYLGWYCTATTPVSGIYETIEGKSIQLQFTIETEQQLIESWLDTDYQSDDCAVLQIFPNKYVNIDIEYNNYHKNCMVKWNPYFSRGSLSQSTNASFLALPTNDAEQPKCYMNVERLPNESKLTIESFDVMNAQNIDVNTLTGFRKITFEPKRIDASNGNQFQLGTTGGVADTKIVNFIDQSSNVIGNYYLLAADTRFYEDAVNRNTLMSATCGAAPWNMNSFSWLAIDKPEFYINQVNILEKVDLETIVRNTKKIMRNQKLMNEWFGGKIGPFANGANGPAYKIDKGRVPFLIINPAQYLSVDGENKFAPNVLNASIQTIAGSYRVTYNIPNLTVDDTTKFNVYPEIFKFNPYLYFQDTVTQPVKKTELRISAVAWSNYLMKTPFRKNKSYELQNYYGGGFDMSEIKSLMKKYGPEILRYMVKGAVEGVRSIASATPKDSIVHKSANAVSGVASAFGYGR